MMSNNPITGDKLISKIPTEDYHKGWDLIWKDTKEIVSNTDISKSGHDVTLSETVMKSDTSEITLSVTDDIHSHKITGVGINVEIEF